MGFVNKIKGMVNPDSVDDNYDSGFDYNENDNGGADDYGSYADDNQQMGNNNNAGFQQQRQNGGMSLNSNALEMKIVRPENYDSPTAQKIADHLLNHRTVVLNLERTNKEASRRLIDFLSGVAYSIDGYIQRVAVNTFIIVPNNVAISGEQLKAINGNQNGIGMDNDELFN